MTDEPLSLVCRPAPQGFVCDVIVGIDADATRHSVTVSRDTLARFAPGHYDPDDLVRASFEYLLVREPRESILPSFELPVIERYFPGYESEIRRRLRR